MAAVTLATLRTRARERADQTNSTFVSDARALDWINEGHAKLHELLIKAYGEEFLETSASITTVNGQDYVNLPNDFFILYGVELIVGGVYQTLKPFNRTERNLYRNGQLGYWRMLPRYKLSGSKLRLLPVPDGVYTGNIWYAPVSTPLSADLDTVNYPNGWERYIVCYTAIQMMMKEESDTRDLRVELQKMEDELKEIAQRRNADMPHTASDIDMVDRAVDVFGWRGI